MPEVRLYSRRGCHLCQEAEELLCFHAPAAVAVDVDSDAALAGRYGDRVPVLEIGGRVVLEGRFDEAELVRALARAAGEAPAA